jgi:hypothetical protein
MAKEICGNGIDEDCSAGCHAPPGAGDEPCVDADGDGEPSDTDCDDNDPCRSTKIKESGSLCNQDPKSFVLPAACQKQLSPPFCDDGIDEDCNGQDAKCVVDKDCDGFSPPLDCNDDDLKINPSASETCDGVDNNCNGVTDEGCVPCDADGDGHALASNEDPSCKAKRDEIDDYDAGIHPETTLKTNGAEGGNVLGALRGWCLSTKGLEKDGAAPREVDHDGDKLPASQDGCPASSCDADGDGFSGKQCSPPASMEDCDDGDPHSFPGAPDRCGDGKAQNCVADTSCACDKDGDGYCAPADCNDGDPAVHPWATEVCDGIDNDCDELTDEANPDALGKPMTILARTCNDDNDGFCGECKWADTKKVPPDSCSNNKLLSGLCICSPINTGKRDPANRVACAGENYAAKASPRCIGARQPEPKERCEPGDFDWQNGPIKKGEDCGDKDRNCGVTAGECLMGKVTDCDLAQNLGSLLPLYKAVDPAFNPYWVCTGGVLPVPEKCNARDDDCKNGPLANEVDSDKDGFLACSGDCSNLVSGFTGCGDCDDKNDKIFPGAPEVCNGKDDNCVGGTDEVPNDCSAKGQTCCSGLWGTGCKDLSSDFYHCKACNQACPAVISNRCSGGVCLCGSNQPCESGQTCEGTSPSGTCTCKGTSCSGCCDNNHCRQGNTVALCGTGGAPCKSCDDGKECTVDACNAGQCSNTNRLPGTLCANNTGKCYNGTCCTGCWDGTTCQTGNTSQACGTGGDTCANCGTGLCVAGKCCAGCWDNGVCRPGNTSEDCGSGGVTCTTCYPNQPCQNASCATGTCVRTPNTGASCTGGRCLNGVCCTNCILGGSCLDWNEPAACGSGGIDCVDCTATGRTCVNQSCNCPGCWLLGVCYLNDPAHCGPSCTSCPQPECKVRTCSGSTCGTTNAPDITTTCSGGVCIGGSCCKTCYKTGLPNTCEAGTTDENCGTGGEACERCIGGKHCDAGDCK